MDPSRRLRGGYPRIAAYLGAAALIAAALLGTAGAGSALASDQHGQVTRSSQVGPVKYYVVQQPRHGNKEFLFEIAAKTLGNGNLDSEIFKLNKGRPQPGGGALENPSDILPGWILILPSQASGPGVHFGRLPVVTSSSAKSASPSPGSTTPSVQHSAASRPVAEPGPDAPSGLPTEAAVGGAVLIALLVAGSLVFLRRRVALAADGPGEARGRVPRGRGAGLDGSLPPPRRPGLPAGAPTEPYQPATAPYPPWLDGPAEPGAALTGWDHRADGLSAGPAVADAGPGTSGPPAGAAATSALADPAEPAAPAWPTPPAAPAWPTPAEPAAPAWPTPAEPAQPVPATADHAGPAWLGLATPVDPAGPAASADSPSAPAAPATPPAPGPWPPAAPEERGESWPGFLARPGQSPAAAVPAGRDEPGAATPLVVVGGHPGGPERPEEQRQEEQHTGEQPAEEKLSRVALRILGAERSSARRTEHADVPIQRHQVALGDDRIDAVLAEAPASSHDGRPNDRKSGGGHSWLAASPYLVWAPLPYDVPDGGAAFACVGAGDEGCLFIDLAAAPGAVAVGGDKAASTRLAESMAHQLALAAESGRSCVPVVVGRVLPEPHPQGAVWVASLHDLASVSGTGSGDATEIVFCQLLSNEDAFALARYVGSAQRRVVPVVVADLPDAPWSFTAQPSLRPADALHPAGTR